MIHLPMYVSITMKNSSFLEVLIGMKPSTKELKKYGPKN